MKRAVLLLLLFLSTSIYAFSAFPENARGLSHHILQVAMTETSSCTATAVGPHALLMASHCELPTNVITIGKETATIQSILRDGNGHTILLLKGVSFSKFAEVEEVEFRPGDHVFIVGNPLGIVHLVREGVIAGFGVVKHRNGEAKTLVLQMDVYPGDSGAGVFTQEGKLFTVVDHRISQITFRGVKIDVALAGCFRLMFTPEQLELAKEFK